MAEKVVRLDEEGEGEEGEGEGRRGSEREVRDTAGGSSESGE